MVTEAAAAVADMSRPPSSSQTTPPFYRVSERDLTEIELHSVDSINDLHRTHHDHSHKGARPPRSPPQSPSPNGNVYVQDTTAANHKGQPISSKWQSHLKDMLNSSSSRAYIVTCGVVTLLLLIVLLIFYFLDCGPFRKPAYGSDTIDGESNLTETTVEQGNALRTLTEAVRDKHTVSMEISQLIQELQALRHNLTAMRGP